MLRLMRSHLHSADGVDRRSLAGIMRVGVRIGVIHIRCTASKLDDHGHQHSRSKPPALLRDLIDDESAIGLPNAPRHCDLARVLAI